MWPLDLRLKKGYLVTVPVDEEGQAMFMLEGWEKAFSTSENVFFKSPETLGMWA